jgi:hypothetical protein
MGSIALATATETIVVDIRRATDENVRMVQAQWSREMCTRWKHRTRIHGDKPGVHPSLARGRQELEERSGLQVGKPGYDQDGNRHEPLILHYDLWRRAHHLLVDILLSSSIVIIATIPGLPADPVGWAAHEGRTLHFVYVVPVARRSTIATQLVLSTRCSAASHMTPDGRGLVQYLRGET